MDEIESLFEDVTPEDLQPPTTALRRMFIQRDLHDEEEFGRFVLTYIEATRIASEVADGYMPGLAVLATADELRVYQGRFDETSRQFLKRVGAEATESPAVWLFAALDGSAVIGQTLDLTTSSGKKAFNGNAIDVINWYAQATTLDLVRYGVLHPADNMRCYVGADPAGADAEFRRILTGAA